MDKDHYPKYTWKIELLETQNIAKVVENEFSVEGHSKMIKDVVSQAFCKPGMNLFVDDRKVIFKNTDIDLVKRVSAGFSAFNKELGSGKTALLMNSLSDYTRGRQFELLTDDKVSIEIRIFMDEDKALEWLTS